MKIKIRKDGFLEIERAGKIKSQFCAVSRLTSRCGDWCPLFGEPKRQSYREGREVEDCIHICGSRILSGEIIDERKREDEKT